MPSVHSYQTQDRHNDKHASSDPHQMVIYRLLLFAREVLEHRTPILPSKQQYAYDYCCYETGDCCDGNFGYHFTRLSRTTAALTAV
jgi:hypothetical protein